MKSNFITIAMLVVLFMGFSNMNAGAEKLAISIASDNAGILRYESADGQYIDLSKSDQVTYIKWNDDGTKLAFIKHTHVPHDNDVREIGIVQFDDNDRPSEPMILQTYRPAFNYNLDWMQDGRILFVTENPDTNPETGLHDKFDIMAIDLDGNDEVLVQLQIIYLECIEKRLCVKIVT